MKSRIIIFTLAAALVSSCVSGRKTGISYGGSWDGKVSKTEASKVTPSTPSTESVAAIVEPQTVTMAPSVNSTENVVSNSSVQTAGTVTTKMTVTPKTIVSKEVQKPVKQNIQTNKKKQAAPQGGGKSQLVAFLLCFFLGVIGVHRFYLGYTLIGILQIITLGGLGIWVLIDLIRIIIGDLKPKGGEYDQTFSNM